jgi:hypothetical protein
MVKQRLGQSRVKIGRRGKAARLAKRSSANPRYLVRAASANGSTLDLTGDINSTTPIQIHTNKTFTAFTWNHSPLHAIQGGDLIWRADIKGPSEVLPSQITNWTYADSLPELDPGFDDGTWVVANKTSTVNPNVVYPDYTGVYNLYLQDYGFFVGTSILRGHFVGTGNETGIDLSLSPGTNGAGAVWVSVHPCEADPRSTASL